MWGNPYYNLNISNCIILQVYLFLATKIFAPKGKSGPVTIEAKMEGYDKKIFWKFGLTVPVSQQYTIIFDHLF